MNVDTSFQAKKKEEEEKDSFNIAWLNVSLS